MIIDTSIKGQYRHISSQYRAFRPTYPPDLYDFIFKQVANKDRAWDCGTGNGQVAYSLSKKFTKVIATDKCEEQIKNSMNANNILYQVRKSENSGIRDCSIDLITCAQAVHWFDIPKFYNEVRRVSKQNAVIALWGYNRFRINSKLDSILDSFFNKYLNMYWQDEPRKLLAQKYSTLPFDFEPIPTGTFEIRVDWKLSQLIGYLKTMSSVNEFNADFGYDPVEDLGQHLMENWKLDEFKEVVFYLFTRIGIIN